LEEDMKKIYVVGLGPGGIDEMTPRARKAIEDSDLVVGYSTYIKLIQDHFPGKKFISSAMKREVERCKMVLEKAQEGNIVALVSSGDSGIYGMAGIILEVAAKLKSHIPVEVVPGITAASAAAAILGAPLMHDFAVISLSDLLTPWEQIVRRIECAAQGDFVICFYNPKSKMRSNYIDRARDIILKHRKGSTPVGIVRNAGRSEQNYTITTLEDMLEHEIDMFTTVIVGNSKTYIGDEKIITPRGYEV
jgi:precorrin-3B C17-methyltransferase